MSGHLLSVEKCAQCGRFIKHGDENWSVGCHYAAGGFPEEEWTVTCGRCTGSNRREATDER